MDIVLEIFLLSGLSYLIYTVCMGKNVPYAARRWYLLVSIAASGIIPFVEIPVDTTMAQQVHKALHYAPQGIMEHKEILMWIYCAGASIMGIIFILQICRIRKRLQENMGSRYLYKGIQVLESNRPKGDEFSFFNRIVISGDLTDKEKELVLAHEISHVKHHHSFEKLLISVIKVAMWFNPFVHIAAIHIEELQEYEADYDVLASGADKKEYVTLIVEQVITSAMPVGSKFYSYFTESRFRKMLAPPLGRRGSAIISFAAIACIMAMFAIQAKGHTQRGMTGIPASWQKAGDTLVPAGQMHLYTPDNEKFKNKIKSVPEPDEQILMIVK